MNMKRYLFFLIFLFIGFAMLPFQSVAQVKDTTKRVIEFTHFKPKPYELPDMGKTLQSDPGIQPPKDPNKNLPPQIQKTETAMPPDNLKLSTDLPAIKDDNKLKSGKNYSKAATESLKLKKP